MEIISVLVLAAVGAGAFLASKSRSGQKGGAAPKPQTKKTFNQDSFDRFLYVFRMAPLGCMEGVMDGVNKRTLSTSFQKSPDPDLLAEAEAAKTVKRERSGIHPVISGAKSDSAEEVKQQIDGWISREIHPEQITARIIRMLLQKAGKREEEELEALISPAAAAAAAYAASYIYTLGVRMENGPEGAALFLTRFLTDAEEGCIREENQKKAVQSAIRASFRDTGGQDASGKGQSRAERLQSSERAGALQKDIRALIGEEFRRNIRSSVDQAFALLSEGQGLKPEKTAAEDRIVVREADPMS